MRKLFGNDKKTDKVEKKEFRSLWEIYVNRDKREDSDRL